MGQTKLLSTRRFFPFFCTQFFGAFNDNLFKNSFILLITYQGVRVFGFPPDQMVALAGGIFILPFFLFSASAGQLADKFEKRHLILWIKAAEILFMAIGVVGFLKHNPELLLLVLFLMGIHSTFFGPIKYSILPDLLKEEELVGGNALVEAGTFLAILLGTIASGILITFDREGTNLVAVGPVIVAVLGYLTSFLIPKTPRAVPDLKLDWNPFRPTLEVYRFTKESRVVYLSVLGISWFWFFGAAILSLLPSYCKDVLHGNERVVTLFMAVFSIGIGVGSLLCERFSRFTLELGLVPLGSIGMSLFVLWLGLLNPGHSLSPALPVGIRGFLGSPAALPILISMLGFSLFSGFFTVPLYTLLQERSSRAHRSRIIAGNNILNAIFMVVAAIYLIVLLKLGFSTRQLFLTLSALNALVAIYIYTQLPEFLYRFLLWALANLVYRLRVRGQINVPKSGACLLVCNHVTFVDWMILAAGIPRPIRFVMSTRYYKGWLTGRLLRRAGAIAIASKNENAELREKAFHEISEALKEGSMVGVFPEGHLTSTGEIDDFKPGIERILASDPVPVLPVGLVGMWGSFFSRERGRAILKWPKRFWSRVELRIGRTLPAGGLTATALRDEVTLLVQTSGQERI